NCLPALSHATFWHHFSPHCRLAMQQPPPAPSAPMPRKTSPGSVRRTMFDHDVPPAAEIAEQRDFFIRMLQQRHGNINGNAMMTHHEITTTVLDHFIREPENHLKLIKASLRHGFHMEGNGSNPFGMLEWAIRGLVEDGAALTEERDKLLARVRELEEREGRGRGPEEEEEGNSNDSTDHSSSAPRSADSDKPRFDFIPDQTQSSTMGPGTMGTGTTYPGNMGPGTKVPGSFMSTPAVSMSPMNFPGKAPPNQIWAGLAPQMGVGLGTGPPPSMVPVDPVPELARKVDPGAATPGSYMNTQMKAVLIDSATKSASKRKQPTEEESRKTKDQIGEEAGPAKKMLFGPNKDRMQTRSTASAEELMTSSTTEEK
ncbi:hypothetical protein PFISCL1PPCAC_8792, partial [Pristionchus fissidentatus]